MGGEATSQTFVFADLAGFTALTEAHGDEQAADVVADFVECTRRHIDGSEVEEVKSIGDALMLRAPDAAEAVRIAVDLSEEIGGRAGFLGLRIGMHTGAAVERQGDWFGSAVNIAARIAALASSGEVLLSEATAESAGSNEQIELTSAGRQQLRNVSEPVRLFKASLAGERSNEGWPIDPVCRMSVEPRLAAGSLTHAGQVFHFCSLQCAASFAAAPESYG
ncbi:MAG: adenylate/guanylate cyclase domain-containing protein [Solirubrobacterales bacterium]